MEKTKCYVKMEDVVLRYPSAVYNSTTLKQVIFAKLTKQQETPRLDDVTALNGFTLEVTEGDRLGVIGANGAGKSTLLKAIAGLYPIAGGNIFVEGEIRSLFDLTLGFDAFSTGRENILYRGLMLGYTPEQIAEIEEEIIEFAGLGKFIDYPISSYSSGMQIRLAFSISTSIKGDILLVDEVLSAGDAAFQEKAKQRMIDAMSKAKILVLVLHDLNSIKQVCNRAIYVKSGKVAFDGTPDDAVSYYLENNK